MFRMYIYIYIFLLLLFLIIKLLFLSSCNNSDISNSCFLVSAHTHCAQFSHSPILPLVYHI